MAESNGKCVYFKKGCLIGGIGCEIDQMKNCERANLWSSTDRQKCPAMNFEDGCDIPDLRRLMIADAGKCYDNGECLRKFYPEIRIIISRDPDIQDIARSIARRRLQNKQKAI